MLRVYVMFWNTVEKKVKLLLIAKMSEGIKWTKSSKHNLAVSIYSQQFYEHSDGNHLHLPLRLHSKQD